MAARIALFDLGNVLLDWEPARLYRQFMPEADAQKFCDEICTLAWHTEHDRGVPMPENAARLIALHPDKADLIRAWESGWLEMFHGEIDGVPDLVRQLRSRGAPLYALTNFPVGKWAETAAAFPILQVFDDVIVSGDEKLVKPDPRIYALTLQRMGNPDPADVFFTDDRAENIRAAEEAGMTGHLFTGAAGLAAALREHGLI